MGTDPLILCSHEVFLDKVKNANFRELIKHQNSEDGSNFTYG
jgi:hypothetical protein